jgi:CRISPR-associated endoribonuclease Cas6
MRLQVSVESPRGMFLLSKDAQMHLQAALYRLMGPEVGTRVHSEGFQHGKRTFRMFVYSDIHSVRRRLQKAPEGLWIHGPGSFVVASPLREIAERLAVNLLREPELHLGPEKLRVTDINLHDPVVTEDEMVVRTLSPIVVYSTFAKPGGGRYTAYFQPGEVEFARGVTSNLRRKYQALYGDASEQPGQLEVETLRQGAMRLRTYKGTVIKGWACTLRLRGDRSLLRLALTAGLGSKNAQGWGCVERLRPGRGDEGNGENGERQGD